MYIYKYITTKQHIYIYIFSTYLSFYLSSDKGPVFPESTRPGAWLYTEEPGSGQEPGRLPSPGPGAVLPAPPRCPPRRPAPPRAGLPNVPLPEPVQGHRGLAATCHRGPE